ncbi:MAG: hypothetical protein N4A76_15755 [Firmicutes bacterium]|jgi:hypothetical protein|nr:hypothetical protein [Bacillota bacterium]
MKKVTVTMYGVYGAFPEYGRDQDLGVTMHELFDILKTKVEELGLKSFVDFQFIDVVRDITKLRSDILEKLDNEMPVPFFEIDDEIKCVGTVAPGVMAHEILAAVKNK